MKPQAHQIIVALAASALAAWLGWNLANGTYFWPGLAGAIATGAILVRLFRMPVDVIALGVLLLGYIVGNRGFAQFSVLPGLPLLPAETGLALCLLCLIVKAAYSKRLPWRRDALNLAVAAWVIVGAVRIVPDMRAHGIVALRDFATIYYALFFFVAQSQSENERAQQFLQRCLLVATVTLIPVFEAFRRAPDFFIATFQIGGTPLIFFKGDLVATFLAAGVLLTSHRFEQSRRAAWLVPALFGILGVTVSGNRASMLALGVMTACLALSGRRSLLWMQLAGVATTGLALLAGMALGWANPRDNAAHQIYERVASITDVAGARIYDSDEAEFKGDNNRFRLVWWRAVIDETVLANPWFGLGFGHDLSAEFVRRYYPDSSDEFSIRSPHSILLTTFGRLGFVGLATLLAVLAVMIRKTHRALHTAEPNDLGLSSWLVAWVVFISACFGVVLEGPMGAVVFWTVLGMANATHRSKAESSPAPVADLRNAAPAIQVTSAP